MSGREGNGGAVSGGATARMARLALRLYPLAYQRRYGDEMRALLEDRPPRVRTVLNLIRAALLAHLRPANMPGGSVDAADRIRTTASGVVMCWVFFAAAGFAYYKSTEDQPFSAAGHVHPLLRDAHLVVQAVALLACAAVALGALPLIASALARAGRDPAFRRTIALPFAPLIVFGILTAVVIAVAHGHTGRASTAGSVVAVAWGIAGIVCGAACVLSSRAALLRTPVPPASLRAALAAATVVTAAMFVIAAATAVYLIALNIDASALGGSSNGPFQLLSETASLILVTIAMAGASVLAAVATLRGWRVRAALNDAAS